MGGQAQVVTFVLDALLAQGETIATALLAAGHWVFRMTDKKNDPRGVYCNIGVCHSCLVVVDGERNVRACQTPVSPGCRVEMQEP